MSRILVWDQKKFLNLVGQKETTYSLWGRKKSDTTERLHIHSFKVKVTVESETVGLKLNIQKTKIMVSGPIASWQIDGK